MAPEVVRQVRHVLADSEYRQQMVEHNYAAARQFYSYERVEHELRAILDKPRPCAAPRPDGAGSP